MIIMHAQILNVQNAPFYLQYICNNTWNMAAFILTDRKWILMEKKRWIEIGYDKSNKQHSVIVNLL